MVRNADVISRLNQVDIPTLNGLGELFAAVLPRHL